MIDKVILLDNGHGKETAGKRSPDGKFREYEWTRRAANAIKDKLQRLGYLVYIVCPEEKDVALSERCRRVNKLCKLHSEAHSVLISIHNNAAGSNGLWRSAGGWSAYTTKGRTKADKLTECLYKAAEEHLQTYKKYMDAGKKLKEYDQKQTYIRSDKSDGDKDMESNFYVLKNSICPAVLTENLFQDNRSDVEFLNSSDGFRSLVDLHVEGIAKYFDGV